MRRSSIDGYNANTPLEQIAYPFKKYQRFIFMKGILLTEQMEKDLKQQQIEDLQEQVRALQSQLAPTNRSNVIYVPLNVMDRDKLRSMKSDLRKLTGMKATYSDVISWLRNIELVYFHKLEEKKDYIFKIKQEINKHQEILKSAEIDVNAVSIPEQLNELESKHESDISKCENPLK